MELNKIYQGDCLDVLPTLPDNSVDSIVTDPPYHLASIVKRFGKEGSAPAKFGTDGAFKRASTGFMGKTWDGGDIAFNPEMWKECLRVLKPGGHLLSFSGTRTYHRMASAIEDAGFEVRDMIEWVYGCLSEDTEILTESGYKPLHKLTQYDRIGVYDITNNIYKWERPQGYSVYKVHQDTAYRIKSDYTDQIVSRNHRCLVEREGKLVFVTAEELKEMEYMPTLSEDFYSLQEGHRKLLLKELLWKGKRLAQKLFSKWTRKEVSSERIEVRKEPSLERWSNLLEETRKLQADKICEVSEGVFTDGKKRWICNGTSFDSGSILGDMFRENPSSASYQSRPTGQPTGKPDVISIKQGTQIIRRARVEKIEYSGIIFCPTVSTGAFIARRNGQVFITGNSGFPKSLNIGKAVDKKPKADSVKDWKIWLNTQINNCKKTKKQINDECGFTATSYVKIDNKDYWSSNLPKNGKWQVMKNVIGITTDEYDWVEQDNCEERGYVEPTGGLAGGSGNTVGRFTGKQLSNNSIDERAKQWEGWGTALKPAHEPICLARKPLEEKTVAENVLKYGTGGINIDESRVEYQGKEDFENTLKSNTGNIAGGTFKCSSKSMAKEEVITQLGRFPANLIHDNSEEVRECFPETKSGKMGKQHKRHTDGSPNGIYGKFDINHELGETYGDSGNASRFFKSIKKPYVYSGKEYEVDGFVKKCKPQAPSNYNDEGSPAKYFKSIIYQAKASKSERNKNTNNYLIIEICVDNMEVAQLQPKVILEKTELWFTELFGKEKMEEYQMDFKSTIKTETKKTTILIILNYSQHLNIKEYIVGAIKTKMESGGNHAVSVENTNEWRTIITDGLMEYLLGVNPVVYPTQLKIRVNANNFHSTVKPIALMEYLIKMVTPKGGIVLDPFAGSGSTLVAAKQNGFQYIGIELTEEYIPIIEARLNALNQDKLL